MIVQVNATGSSGNSYILTDDKGEVLIIECGISYKNLLKALNYNVRNVKGCIVSHCHSDHNAHADDYKKHGIKVFQPFSEYQKCVWFGKYKVMPFELVHDVICYGFLITNTNANVEKRISYITDTEYSKYRFERLTCLMVECNYSNKIIENNQQNYNHILTGHLELETTKGIVSANDNEDLNSVLLIHASETNGDKELFQTEVESITDKRVFVADKGLKIEI